MDIFGGDVTSGYSYWIANKRYVHSLHKRLQDIREISENVIKW